MQVLETFIYNHHRRGNVVAIVCSIFISWNSQNSPSELLEEAACFILPFKFVMLIDVSSFVTHPVASNLFLVYVAHAVSKQVAMKDVARNRKFFSVL